MKIIFVSLTLGIYVFHIFLAINRDFALKQNKPVGFLVGKALFLGG
jgi:hypothetical protein